MVKATEVKQIELIRELAHVMIDTCKQAGRMGAPGGHLYAACMGIMSLDQFTSFMGTLVKRHEHQCYVYVKGV